MQNLRLSWIAIGWLLASAIVSLILLAINAIAPSASESPTQYLWVVLAMVIGFGSAGAFVGSRTAAAPWPHATGIALMSLAVWFLANLTLGEATNSTTWRSLSPGILVGLLVLQALAAAIGLAVGRRMPSEAI